MNPHRLLFRAAQWASERDHPPGQITAYLRALDSVLDATDSDTLPETIGQIERLFALPWKERRPTCLRLCVELLPRLDETDAPEGDPLNP